jgi:hypothetical protein
MGTHTLLRQRSDLGARYYVSQFQRFGGLRGGPGLSGRVVLYQLGGSQNRPRRARSSRMVILWITRCTRSAELIDLYV